MQFQTKYVIASVIGLICAILFFIIIKSIYSPPESHRVYHLPDATQIEISGLAEQLESNYTSCQNGCSLHSGVGSPTTGNRRVYSISG